MGSSQLRRSGIVSCEQWNGGLAYHYQEGDFVGVNLGKQRAIQQGEQHGRRDRVLEVTSRPQSVSVALE